MAALAHLAAGLIFGLGLVVSGLINPAKVLNFLDLAGDWDPSLAFTMAAAVLTTGIGYRLAFRRGAPFLVGAFQLPTARTIDARLLSGAAIFGIGWGLAGFCPGPAVAALSSGAAPVFVFVTAMLAGMAAARWLDTSQPEIPQSQRLAGGDGGLDVGGVDAPR